MDSAVSKKSDLELLDDSVEVCVHNMQLQWYQARGYNIPTLRVQLWCKNAQGKRVKNGVKHRVARRTKIWVQRKDLPPSSNMRVQFTCGYCGDIYFTQWRSGGAKNGGKCNKCVKKTIKDTGCHSYWCDQLITNNPDASCEVSGEKDKRFLVLHHLLSRALGGKNERSNYVILSANYHMAFHVWNGGTNAVCTPGDYYTFKELELTGSHPVRKI